MEVFHMAMTPSKRKKMEELIYSVFDALDPSKTNSSKYKSKFKKLSDAQFDNFFKQLFANDDHYLILDTVDYERDLSIENVENASKLLKVDLFEHVVMPFVNQDKENPTITKFPVPVGYMHIKRMQQMLQKKNSTSIEIGTRSSLTGQVTREDKNTRDSDVENFALATLNATNTLRELLGPRSDDIKMKSEMYSEIARTGFVSLDNLTNDVSNKTTLNTVNALMIGMGIKPDFITDGLIIKREKL